MRIKLSDTCKSLEHCLGYRQLHTDKAIDIIIDTVLLIAHGSQRPSWNVFRIATQN